MFFQRFSAALAITTPLALLLLKAPLSEGPRAVHSLRPPASLTSFINLVPAAVEAKSSDRESMLLQQAFSTQTSHLLWSEALPISDHEPDTIENVRLAADAVDFSEVLPGEIFSFNDIVGMRTEDKGYRPGMMYSSGEVVTGIGGGICIASTMLYRAALESGFQIVERHPHSGPVSYADPGRDAAVSFGWADMRFKNDSDSLLLIRSAVEDDRLILALYGEKKQGRTIEIVSEDYEEFPYRVIAREDDTLPEGGMVVERRGRPGFAVTTVRLFKENGRLVKREVISRDVVLPCNKLIVRANPEAQSLPEARGIRVPFRLPDRESLPLPPTHGTITIPNEAQGFALPSDRNLSTSERTASTASE